MAKRSKEEITELLAEVTDGKYAELKATNERLLKRIDKLKDKNADMMEAVYRAVKDGILSLDLPPIKAPPKSRKTAGEEICVPLLSDIQLARLPLRMTLLLLKKELSNTRVKSQNWRDYNAIPIQLRKLQCFVWEI